MSKYIVVAPLFEDVWPLVADHLRDLWSKEGQVEFIRIEEDDSPTGLCDALTNHSDVDQLISLGLPVSEECLDTLTGTDEAFVLTDSMYSVDDEIKSKLEDRGVTVHDHTNEGFWGESVAEFAICLTINALRKIPQKYKAMITGHGPWDLEQLDNETPGARGHQFADDPVFVNGTIADKRICVVGVGNIGSRYVSYVDAMGANVTAYDPYADESCFHRSGAKRVWCLEELLDDPEIFAPMVPLTDATRGLITAEHIYDLPKGCLVVLATRAQVCDMDAIRERVLANEILLAADVWDEEPLSLDDPLLDRDNVVHTPHIAGRTRDANERWAKHLLAHFT